MGSTEYAQIRHKQSSYTQTRLLETEALGLVDGQSDLLHEGVVRLVGREVETVETRVAQRQGVLFARPLYCEELETVASWKKKAIKKTSD